jgi:quercetin dioxygenase-like cupin family protein
VANVSDSAGFIVATDQLIGSYSDAWLRSDAWADPDTTEPVWYENVRVFHWIEPAANQTDGLVVEKFIQKLGAYLPAHAHPKSPVRLYLLSGSILLIMDGRITVLKPGERAFIPDDKEHAVFASEDSECVSVHYEVGGLTISERYGAGDIVGDVFSALRGRFLAHDNESGSHFEFINKIQN